MCVLQRPTDGRSEVFGLELAVYMWKTLWRWGKEPAERSGLNNPDVNTGLGKRRIPTNQSIEGTGQERE